MMPNGSPLTAWENFYVILGSSAAALTGLQFVVIALVGDVRRRRPVQQDEGEAVRAFSEPTLVHFAAVLLIAAIVSAPWPALGGAALTLGACGCAGVGYLIVVARRARSQTAYQVVIQDWIWHVTLPLVAYAALLAASTVLIGHVVISLFTIGAVSLLLLFIGIHNAWDTVIYVAIDNVPPGDRVKGAEEADTTGPPGA
jgi:hypothetical protein